VLAWLLVQGSGAALPLPRSVCEFGLIPGELTSSLSPGSHFPVSEGLVCLTDPGRQLHNIITSMFLHGSWMHLLGNMWFLWLFGNNIEDSMTRPRFLAFYLLAGLAAALVQVFANPASPVPMVGASGAISGVMGAYLVLFPRVRVFTVVPLGFYITSIALPALGDAHLLGLPSSSAASPASSPRRRAGSPSRPTSVDSSPGWGWSSSSSSRSGSPRIGPITGGRGARDGTDRADRKPALFQARAFRSEDCRLAAAPHFTRAAERPPALARIRRESVCRSRAAPPMTP
jgi:membrane associated rhomboid family serine protease